jgi:hypothetical protein
MKQYKSTADDWQSLRDSQIKVLLNSDDPLKMQKAETVAALYLLSKIGYDETGAPEHIILAATNALHEIIGIYLGIYKEVE